MSMITTSTPLLRACAIASKATAPGSEPSGAGHDLAARALAPSPRAARSRPRGTCRRRRAARCSPSSWRRCHASLPIVVVLPVPLTPTARITVGFARMSIAPPPRARSRRAARSAARSAPRRPRARPRVASASSVATTDAVVLAPTSAMISASSRRSQVCSSSAPNSVAWISEPSAWRVFDMLSRSRRKRPPAAALGAPPPASALARGPAASR